MAKVNVERQQGRRNVRHKFRNLSETFPDTPFVLMYVDQVGIDNELGIHPHASLIP